MLQGQEKSHSIIDSHAPSPFSSFSCNPLPEVGVDRMFLGPPKVLSPLHLCWLTLSEHTGSTAGYGGQVAMGEQSYSLYTRLF